jgi:hypothetical protein
MQSFAVHPTPLSLNLNPFTLSLLAGSPKPQSERMSSR